MKKELLFTASNFRKNKGTSIGLFFLMLVLSALIGISFLLFFDIYPIAQKEANRLDAGDGYIWLSNYKDKIDDTNFKELFDKNVAKYDTQDLLSYTNISIPFGDGSVSPNVLIDNGHAFQKKSNRTEIVVEDSSVTENYIYLPYQFYTGGGIKLGDRFSFDLKGNKQSYTVKGFTLSTYYGTNNNGIFEFIVDNTSYKVLSQRDKAAKSTVINFKLKDSVKINKFKIQIINFFLSKDVNSVVSVVSLDEALKGKSFLALVLLVSFLGMAIILLFVIMLMLTNSVINYINENMKVIGAMKAMGYTSRNIISSLYLWFGSLAIIGGTIGAIASYALMPFLTKIVVGQLGIPYTVAFRIDCTVVSIALVVLFVLLITGLSARKIKKITPIVALRSGVSNHSFKINPIHLKNSIFGVNLSLALKTMFVNFKQNIITFFVIGFLIFSCVISLMLYENLNSHPKVNLFTFEISAGTIGFDSETKEEAKKYLEERNDTSNIRRMVTLYLTYNNEDRLVTWVFDDVNKMNNKEIVYDGRLPKYENEIALSGKFAKDYGFHVGDEIKLDYGKQSHTYIITGFIQTLNNYGREAVMNESAANYLTDLTNASVTLWFDSKDSNASSSQVILDDVTQRYGEHVLSSLNFFKILKGHLTIFKSITSLMMLLIYGISAIVIVLVLYLLVKSLIYKKRKEYGIYKALGYTSTNLIFQTTLSFMPPIISSVILFSIVSYYIANPYLNIMLSTFGVMRSSFVIPVTGVVVIGIGMIVLSFIFTLLQVRKIKKIEAYQMLIGE